MIINDKNGKEIYYCANDTCDTLLYTPSRDFMLTMCPHCGNIASAISEAKIEFASVKEKEVKSPKKSTPKKTDSK
tara:strand:+ start:1986 stop:2210 length:225 start_codon:yes stop_codon:yes gene_type:complete